jgi:hypothetical protein
MAVFTHQEGTPVVWADSTDYSSTNSGLSRTHQLLLENLANNAAREGAKADLGVATVNRAPLYAVRVGFECNSAPTAGTLIEVYWSSSFSTTATVGNDGGAIGSDAAYHAAEEDEWKKQLIYLGALVTTADTNTVPQYQTIGYFTPPHRYGMPVVVNKSGVALNATDAIEMFVALIPIVHNIA